MSNLTPTRLYVEAQTTLACFTNQLQKRWDELQQRDEDGWEIPANTIIMVGLIAAGLLIVAGVATLVKSGVAKMQMP